jgi:hypothetical protein
MNRLTCLLLVLAACDVRTVSVRGAVMHTPGDKSRGLADATLTIHDQFGAPFDEDVTNLQGRFRVEAPAGRRIFAVVDVEGYARSSFTGASATGEIMNVPDGQIYAVPPSVLGGWLDAFEGCPGLDGDGGIVIGEVRAVDLVDPDTGVSPIITTASSSFIHVDGTDRSGCYLDADGVAYDPTAEVNGPSGWFLVADVPAGVGTLVLDYYSFENPDGSKDDARRVTFDVYMPAGGVAPRFPTWVEAPLASL